MTTTHPDRAHHHPVVRRTALGRWMWSCDCGGASCRISPRPSSWHQVVVEALRHSSTIAP